jgi:hypothetical protein
MAAPRVVRAAARGVHRAGLGVGGLGDAGVAWRRGDC